MEFTNIFSTPLFVSKINKDISFLLNECKKEREESDGRLCSNIGGWQSNNFDGKQLQKIVEDELQQYANQIGILQDLEVSNYWYNINTSRNQNRSHTHPGSILSGVIYLKCPLSSSPIVFLNPNHLLISSYVVPSVDFSFTPHLSPHYIQYVDYADIIIFPSWLEHYVPTGNYEGERISLSFNTKIKKN